MTDDRKSGVALIVGSVGAMVTMAIHPTTGLSLTPEKIAQLRVASGAAHTLALLSVLVLFLGACGLVRRIAGADRLAFAAIITYGFSCIAVLNAAAVSGFIVPRIMSHMVRDVPAAAREWQIVIDGIFQMNQAFSIIFSVGASLAIILWSVSALRNGGFSRGIAIYGCVMAAVIIVGIGMGHLRLDVHGMTLVMAGQVVWFILVGAQLWSRSPGARAA